MLPKPEHVFNREIEWRILTDFALSLEADVRMGVVSGRRRQGKTYLLRSLTDATNGFYFTASESTAVDGLREYALALAEHIDTTVPPALRDWDEAIRLTYELVPDGLIVIDEFPYLMKASPELPSLIQRALDPRGLAHRGSRARLLLCGSAMSVMGRLLSGTAPLRGRAGLELLIHPFDYETSARFWNIDDPRLAVLVHSIVGGTPAYRRAFVRGDIPASLDDFDDWVKRTVLNPGMPLFREARYLLAEETEIRDVALYNSVLGAIAAGNHARGRIASYIGRKDSELSHPLTVLQDAGLVAREDDPFHAKRSVFRIAEPLITFYEVVLRRPWALLEQRQADAVWRSSQPSFLAQVVGPHFEALCRTFTLRKGFELFGDLPADVAAGTVPDPARRTQIQVDIVVLAPAESGVPRKLLALGEAKWGKIMGVRHLDRLRRARDLLGAKGFDTSTTRLVCFGGNGFDPELRGAADQSDVLLVGLNDLYTG